MTGRLQYIKMFSALSGVRIFPQKSYIPPPPKNLRIRQMSATCAAKSFQLLGASVPDPLNRGCAPGPRWGNSPDPSAVASIHWCPRSPDTLGFWPCGVEILCAKVQKASTSGGHLSPDPLAKLCSWTTLGIFRSSDSQLPYSCIMWQ